jgi:hypothetical protein
MIQMIEYSVLKLLTMYGQCSENLAQQDVSLSSVALFRALADRM